MMNHNSGLLQEGLVKDGFFPVCLFFLFFLHTADAHML